jgi:class 3 adenylate cyclase
MVGERRIVTMLFCDIKGSTAAAEHLDPEDWAEIMNGAFEYMIRPVYKYEGTVARLMGDAVLAFFGAPISHEDDPQRAILAGLAIDVRVGINTGLVMVGAIGSDLSMEYTAMGDAINLAARMEQTARPGTVQVAEDTYQLVTPVFEWESLGEVQVKGKTEPVRAFRPLSRKAWSGRLRGIQGLESPLVGRQAELQQLRTVAGRVRKGVGGIVFILGEAGLGKSRLVEELHQSLLAEDALPMDWYETASLSYETSQPYALFQRLLRRRWEISPNAPQDFVRERIVRQFKDHPQEERTRLQEIFENLMGVGVTGGVRLEGETFKRQLFSAMNALWDLVKPAVIVCDDLHWADSASIELLAHLFERAERAALLIICLMRPDRSAPGWEAKEVAARQYPHRYTEILLQPLVSDEINALVDNLLTIADLPSQLRRRILAKTDGNPFFVEEVVRALIDSGAIRPEINGQGLRWRAAADVEDIEIPGNLQSLLIARIDRLEEDARHTLQLASVIGRSFYFRLLDAINQAITAVHSELDRQLLALERVELIREAARVPELEYTFRHSLTQEAAYNTILLRQRREYHRRTAEAIEALYPERLEEFYPMLAYHFAEADDPRALRYAILAGDAAFRLFAVPEALEHYSRALAYTKGGTESPGTLTHIYLRRGRCLELQSDYPGALQTYAEMAALAREGNHQTMLLAALQAQATAYAIPGHIQDAETGEQLAQDALALARQLGDRKAEAKILWIHMLLKIYSGHMPDGIPFGERSAALARELEMHEQLAHSLQDLGLAYMAQGLLEQADAVLAESRSIWETLRDLPMLAENWSNSTYIRVMTADFDGAMAASDESFRIAQSIGNDWGQVNARAFVVPAYLARGEVDRTLQMVQPLISAAEKIGHPGNILGQFYLAWLYDHLGAHDLALEAAQRGVEASGRFPPFRSLSLAMLARGRVRAGAWAQAQTLLEQADQPESRQTLQMIDLIVDLVTVEYHLARHDFAHAEAYLDILLGKMSDSGARYFLPDALHLKAKFLLDQGGAGEALDTLRQARAAAQEIGSRIILWRILADLGEVEAALQEVDFIAGNISGAALRKTFRAHAKSRMEGGMNAF